MRAQPGGADIIPESGTPRVEAALIAVRCTVCHDEALAGQLALQPRAARQEYLTAKLRRIRPVFRLDERHDLMFAFDTLLDEPRREVENRTQ